MTSLTIEAEARRMYAVLADGGLALAQTKTGYGLVAMKSQAVERIYALKGRSAQKPCVTVGSMAILDDIAVDVEPETRGWLSMAERRWPMAVIARMNRRSTLIAGFEPFVRSQCTKADTIATFFGVGALISRTAEIAYQNGQLIVGSSANLSGTGNNYTLASVPKVIRDAVDVQFDHGVAPFTSEKQLASTILDLTRGSFQREGCGFAQVQASWNAFLANGLAPLSRAA